MSNTYRMVWLIDDDSIHNMVLEILIKRSGFAENVLSFTNARYAIEALTDANEKGNPFPDVIFLDLNMNDMNGWEFLEHYHKFDDERKSKCKVFVLTSSVNRTDRERALQNEDVAEFLSKPITLDFFQKKFLPV